MAFNFSVTVPEGMSKLKQDSQGRASLQVVLKNLSGRALDGRLVPISLPKGTPGAVEKGWVKVDEKADRHFDVGKEETFTVRLSVPSNAAAGDYSFRLDAVWVDQPDQADSSSAIGFTVAAKEKKETSVLVWLIPLLVVVVIGLGVGMWLLLRPSGIPVPDLRGQTIDSAGTVLKSEDLALDTDVQTVGSKPEDAGKVLSQSPDPGKKLAKGGAVKVTVGAPTVPNLQGLTLIQADAALKKAGLTLDQNVQTVESRLEDSDRVIKQAPASGEKGTTGQAVQVTLGAEMVAVPQLIGVPYNQVLGILAARKLGVGQTTVATNPSFTAAVVWGQTPPAQQTVKSGTAVNLQVTPQMVTVPSVIGQPLGVAMMNLRGLNVTSFSGNYNLMVIAQNPPQGTSVPVGTSVTLTFPCIWGNCVYSPYFVQRVSGSAFGRELEQQKVPPPK